MFTEIKKPQTRDGHNTNRRVISRAVQIVDDRTGRSRGDKAKVRVTITATDGTGTLLGPALMCGVDWRVVGLVGSGDTRWRDVRSGCRLRAVGG